MRAYFRKSLLLEILTQRLRMRVLIVFLSLGASIFGLLNPLFQKEFIEAVLGHASQLLPQLSLSADDRRLYFLFAVIATVLIAQVFTQAMAYVAAKESNVLQAELSDRVYAKTLGLRTEALRDRPMGEVVSLYTTDVQGAAVLIEQSLPSGASILFPLILVPVVLVQLYHVPIFAMVSTMVFIFVANLLLSTRQARFFAGFKRLAAERTGLVNEWVQNIRSLRILGWISSYEGRIFRTREQETVRRVAMVTNGQMMSSFAISITFVVNVVAIASLVHARPEAVNAGELVAIMWLVGIFLARSFRQMPWFLTFIMDGLTSVQRLERFFELENSNGTLKSGVGIETHAKGVATSDAKGVATSDAKVVAISDAAAPGGPQGSGLALKVSGLNLILEKHALLQDIQFDIKPGEWISIVGEVGAGKSLLLQSLLGETRAEFKSYDIGPHSMLNESVEEIRKHFAYVPQEGFVMSASLRENIFFDYEPPTSNDTEIEESLSLAQIELSLERFVDGLSTEIGERGVNLSGGQRQRVGLARAHFRGPSILLLDDCLSAVDVDTERNLVESLLCGVWKNHTRVLVTHRLSVLPECDRVFFMQRGRVIAQGAYQNLLQECADFRAFVREQTEQEMLDVRAEVTP